MTGAEWAVVAAGMLLIAAVNWYFFGSPAGAAAVATGAGVQQVRIVVRAGYQPSVIRVRAGHAVRLVFERQETSGCSEEVVFPDFQIRRYLPAGEPTTIELKSLEAGEYEFMCGMSMLRGKLIVEE